MSQETLRIASFAHEHIPRFEPRLKSFDNIDVDICVLYNPPRSLVMFALRSKISLGHVHRMEWHKAASTQCLLFIQDLAVSG